MRNGSTPSRGQRHLGGRGEILGGKKANLQKKKPIEINVSEEVNLAYREKKKISAKIESTIKRQRGEKRDIKGGKRLKVCLTGAGGREPWTSAPKGD